MERPEFNELKKIAAASQGLIVNASLNSLSLELYNDGKCVDMCMIMKFDPYKRSKDRLGRIIDKAREVNEGS